PWRGVSLAAANVVTPYFVRVIHAVQRHPCIRRGGSIPRTLPYPPTIKFARHSAMHVYTVLYGVFVGRSVAVALIKGTKFLVMLYRVVPKILPLSESPGSQRLASVARSRTSSVAVAFS
ncbi:MAG: hypothetical protein WHT29_12655, partial [Bacteroidales bacterium]